MDLRILWKICLLAVISSGAGVNGANGGAGLPEKKKRQIETMENTPNEKENFNYEISNSKSDSNRKYERTNDESSTWQYVTKHHPTNNSSLDTVFYSSFDIDQGYNTRRQLNSSKKKSYRYVGASEGPYEEECPDTCLHPPTPEMNLWCQANGCIATRVRSGSRSRTKKNCPYCDGNPLEKKRCPRSCRHPANIRIQRTCKVVLGCKPEVPTERSCPNECNNPANIKIERACVAMGCVPELDPGLFCPDICQNPDDEAERACLGIGCISLEYCPQYCATVEFEQCMKMGCGPDNSFVVNTPPAVTPRPVTTRPVVNTKPAKCPRRCYEKPISYRVKAWCVERGCP